MRRSGNYLHDGSSVSTRQAHGEAPRHDTAQGTPECHGIRRPVRHGGRRNATRGGIPRQRQTSQRMAPIRAQRSSSGAESPITTQALHGLQIVTARWLTSAMVGGCSVLPEGGDGDESTALLRRGSAVRKTGPAGLQWVACAPDRLDLEGSGSRAIGVVRVRSRAAFEVGDGGRPSLTHQAAGTQQLNVSAKQGWSPCAGK